MNSTIMLGILVGWVVLAIAGLMVGKLLSEYLFATRSGVVADPAIGRRSGKGDRRARLAA